MLALRAVPAAGYRFDRWDGACSDFVACEITMDRERQAQASFVAVDAAADCAPARAVAGQPARFASGHPKLLLNHTALRDCLRTKLRVGAPEATRLKAQVDRALAGRPDYGYQPWYAALLYQLSDDVRYRELAVRQTEALVAGEEVLIASGRTPEVAGDSYLYINDWVGNVARVYDWCYDALTPAQRSRWLAYANQAVWNVWKAPPDPSGGLAARWGERVVPWSGWATDNPANNYYLHFLDAGLLLGLATQGESAQAAEWLDLFRNQKLERELWPLYARDLSGGGSLEGTGYGTSMRLLWNLYETWERSTGERIVERSPHALASMAHLLHSIAPSLDRLAPTGDHARDSTAALFDYHRDYLQGLIALYPQERLSAVAAQQLERSSVPRMRHSFSDAQELLNAAPRPAAPSAELSTVYWGSGTGQLMMRTDWTPDAAYANFICGPYKESHAHQDQGSFVIFRGGWLADDANLRSHSGIEQDLSQHNLVRLRTLDGRDIPMTTMGEACALKALADRPLFSYAAADVTPVYAFRNADVNHYNNHLVQQVQREFLFLRPSTFVVLDRVASTETTRMSWLLNLPALPTLQGDRASLSLNGRSLDVHAVQPAGAAWQGASVDGGARLERSLEGRSALFLHVLGAQGAVQSVERLEGPATVKVRLADGRVATLRFNAEGFGGSLELLDAQGRVLTQGALPGTVTAPPLFTGTPG